MMFTGIDIIDIDRVKASIIRTPRMLERIYTPGELEYCWAKSNPYPSLAVRFAAKEALRKLHPAFSRGIRFHDVEVIIGEYGRPELVLHGTARQKCEDENITGIALSLSHARQQAVAIVIASKGW